MFTTYCNFTTRHDKPTFRYNYEMYHVMFVTFLILVYIKYYKYK